MFETQPEKPSKLNAEVFLGFLFGIVASLGCLFLAIFFGYSTADRSGHGWVFPLITAIALILVGIVPLRKIREPKYYPSYALGMVIALSLALLLDGACALAFFRK